MGQRRPSASGSDLRIEYLPLSRLARAPRNPKAHDVPTLQQSLGRFGYVAPMVLDDATGRLVAGHGRLEALEQAKAAGAAPPARVRVVDGEWLVPVVRGVSFEGRDAEAYLLADNQLTVGAGWGEGLEEMLRDLAGAEALLGVGFSDRDLAKLLGSAATDEVPAELDRAAELQAKWKTARGQLWTLGEHRLLCGDATSAADVARLMGDGRAHLLHADPPYGMGKEADGVINDNLYGEKLDAFQMQWWATWRPFLSSNASAYIWGNAPDLWRLWYSAGLGASEPLTLRNEIVWDKNNIAGMASPDLSQYPEASERCLFFQLGRYVLLINRTKDDYWEGWEPIRAHLVEQLDLIGWEAGDVRRICGNHMYGHWFSKSQWSFISRGNYEKLQAAAEGRAFLRNYNDLRAEYLRLLAEFNGEIRGPRREDFNAARPYFDNAHDVMRDVWEFRRVTGNERYGHATPKPVAMVERIMRSSARAGETCVEPFCGSGSTLIAAETTDRRCYSMEIEPKYVAVTLERLASMGLTPELVR